MKTRNGGQEAKAGFWWNTGSWEINLIEETGDALPGGDNVKYVRIPTIALVLLGPIMGALFVMFLPFVGFAMLSGALARKVGKSLATGGRVLASLGSARHATPNGAASPKGHELAGGGNDDERATKR